MRTIAPESAPRDSWRAQIRRAPATLFSVLLLLGALGALAACDPARGTIGAVIVQDDSSGRLFVRDAPPGLAAAKAGLKRGDEILLIDGLDVRSMEPKQIHLALSGEVDATVKLTLVRSGQIIRATVKRTEARKLIKRVSEE
jgi:C-terminal processing protease CtpA/Prc